MMKFKQNKLKTLALALFSIISVYSQNIEKLYVNMPDGLNPTMTKKNRMELLEYHKAGQGDSTQNRFGNQVYLQTFDTLNSLIVVRNTTKTTFEMKLLHTDNGAEIVGVIRSVCAPICQSVVEFYDTAWHKIPLQFNMPKAIQWIDAGKLNLSEIDKVWIRNVLENSFISLHFDLRNQYILATNNSAEFLSEADRKVVLPVLKNRTIIFQLEGLIWAQKP